MNLAPDVVTVAVTKIDGGLTVLRLVVNEYVVDPDDPTKRIPVNHQDPSPERVERTLAKYVDSGTWTQGNGKLPVSWRFVPNDFAENEDRTYRNAWKDTGKGRPDHDMVKARNIHRDHLRRARIRHLDTLDVEYQQADEQSNQNKKREIAARKQKLRDVTDDPRIESAATTDDLKTLTLEMLTGE